MKGTWKQLLDELEVQLSLGQAEGRDAYEDQKKKLKVAVHHAKEKVAEFKSLSESLANELTTNMESLELQLALGKAEGKVAFDEQKAKVENALSDLRATLNEAKDDSDEQFEEWRAQFDSRLNIYRLKLDLFKLHFALGKAEAESEFNEIRSELKSSLNEAVHRADTWKDEVEEDWDDIFKDLKSGFDMVKRKIDNLFS